MPDKVDMARALRTAFPLEEHDFVTNAELKHTLGELEKRYDDKLTAVGLQLRLEIKHAEMSQKNWILSGAIAVLLSTGLGYVSLVTKLDRLEQNLPRLEAALKEQTATVKAQTARDAYQDHGISEVNPEYDVRKAH